MVRQHEVADPRSEYQERLRRTTAAADDQAKLAQWCAAVGLREQAAQHAQRALASDPQNDPAREVLLDLRYVEEDGRWTPEADYLNRTGRVRYGKEYLTKEEAEQRKALEEAEAAQRKAQEQEAATKARQAAQQRRADEIRARLASLSEDDKTITAAIAAAEKAQADYVELVKTTRSTPPPGGPGGGGPTSGGGGGNGGPPGGAPGDGGNLQQHLADVLAKAKNASDAAEQELPGLRRRLKDNHTTRAKLERDLRWLEQRAGASVP